MPSRIITSRQSARHKPYKDPITVIRGKGVNEMPTEDLLFLHTSFVHEKETEDQDSVVEIDLDSFHALMPPKEQHVSGDRTRPWFVIRYDDDRDEVRRPQVPPPHLRISRRESNELFISVPSTPNGQCSGGGGVVEEEGEGYYPEWEREWRLYERKERVAHEVRVAASRRCFQPVPIPIAQYSGPMRAVCLDRLAALTNPRGEDDQGDGEEEEESEAEEDVVQPLSVYENLVWVNQETQFMETEAAAQTLQQQEREKAEEEMVEEEATKPRFRRVATEGYRAARGHGRSLTTPPDTPELLETQRLRRLSDELFLVSDLGSSRTWT